MTETFDDLPELTEHIEDLVEKLRGGKQKSGDAMPIEGKGSKGPWWSKGSWWGKGGKGKDGKNNSKGKGGLAVKGKDGSKGKGKGYGDGKGKGGATYSGKGESNDRSNGYCSWCWKWGHPKRACFHYKKHLPDGKGKAPMDIGQVDKNEEGDQATIEG